MSSVDDFRRLALALPDVIEGAHQGHPDFRVHGRVIASLHPDDRTAMVRVDPEEQRRLVAAMPTAFAPASGAWGRAGCTLVTLAVPSRTVLRDALTSAWQYAIDAGATASRRRKKSPNTTTPRRGPTVPAARRRRRSS